MRYERKYRTEELDFREVQQAIRSHPQSFRTLFPDRQVNNIYFDTPELHFLHENLNGVPQRRKYRIRWYGADITHAAEPVLEMKAKDGELGEKLVAQMPSLQLSDGNLLMQEFATAFRNLPAQPTLLTPQDLRPVLLNTYLRSYLISHDGRFRLTIDRDMRHYTFNARLQPLPTYCRDEAVVVEVKYEDVDDQAYATIGQRLPFRLARNSKYTIGMLLVANV